GLRELAARHAARRLRREGGRHPGRGRRPRPRQLPLHPGDLRSRRAQERAGAGLKERLMRLELTAGQRAARDEFRGFVAAEILPHADRWDREAAISPQVIEALRAQGYLGSNVTEKFGGVGRDMITYGLLTEEIGRGCSSVRSLLTVHDMVAHAIQRWGSAGQRERFLPALARAEVLAALALSEPNAGSDAAGVETTAVRSGDGWVLDGRKKWPTFGQIAGLFLVLARSEGQPTAFLVERETPGL